MGLAGGGAFTGQSRTLAGGPAAPLAASPSAPSAASAQPIVHTITFYSNGVFTVDDGGAPALLLKDACCFVCLRLMCHTTAAIVMEKHQTGLEPS